MHWVCWAGLGCSAERNQLHSQISPSHHAGDHHSAGAPFQLEFDPHQEPVLELLSLWGSAPRPSLPQAYNTPGFESCTVLDPVNKLMSLSLFIKTWIPASAPLYPSFPAAAGGNCLSILSVWVLGTGATCLFFSEG